MFVGTVQYIGSKQLSQARQQLGSIFSVLISNMRRDAEDLCKLLRMEDTLRNFQDIQEIVYFLGLARLRQQNPRIEKMQLRAWLYPANAYR